MRINKNKTNTKYFQDIPKAEMSYDMYKDQLKKLTVKKAHLNEAVELMRKSNREYEEQRIKAKKLREELMELIPGIGGV